MIVTSILFNKEHARKYGLTKKILGEPSRSSFNPCDYSINIANDTILINGDGSIDCYECEESQFIIKKILKALTKMIQNGDFVKEKSQIIMLPDSFRNEQ